MKEVRPGVFRGTIEHRGLVWRHQHDIRKLELRLNGALVGIQVQVHDGSWWATTSHLYVLDGEVCFTTVGYLDTYEEVVRWAIDRFMAHCPGVILPGGELAA